MVTRSLLVWVLLPACHRSEEPPVETPDTDTQSPAPDSTSEPVDTGSSGTTADTGTVPDPTGTAYAELSAGEELTCWRDALGEVGCRGSTRWNLPAAPAGPFVDIVAGWDTACAVRTTGEIACWGCDWVSDLCAPPPGDRWVAVDAASDTFCAEDTDGGVSCWSSYGGYGSGPEEGESYATWAVGVTGFVGIRTGSGIADTAPEAGEPDVPLSEVAAGRSATCGILASNGDTRCWDHGGPVPPDGLAAIDGYDEDFCFLTLGGQVDCLRNHPDLARDGFDPAVEVFGSVSGGVDHACGVTVDGRGFCWPRDGRAETTGIPELL